MLFGLFLAFFAMQLSAQAPVDISKLEVKQDIYYSEGKPFTGNCFALHPNGKIGMKGKMQDGLKEDVWIWWYSDGIKKRESSYQRNKKEGYTYFWHQNGIKAKEILYKNDKNIDQKLWDEQGIRLPNPSFESFK
jgi:antitoxin component YwqK of YwqJK toxin-antitoxin module